MAARDRRQELLDRQLASGCPATLFLSLNIPGTDKHPPGVEALFAWALARLKVLFPDLITLSKAIDYLGPYALLALHQEALSVKQQCMALETSHPAARLIDLDVYDQNGTQLGRSALALPPRPCLVCHQPAFDCIRLGRHRMEEVVEIVEQLLMDFSLQTQALFTL
ncbi:MAG: citrate lyase holo-[acyl-carrier protein] synthase [Desulfuromonadales bacterium]|nr:citrate lyase holo-[acyl-carrier protein] synthase [Desulfuromonadales bacterium]